MIFFSIDECNPQLDSSMAKCSMEDSELSGAEKETGALVVESLCSQSTCQVKTWVYVVLMKRACKGGPAVLASQCKIVTGKKDISADVNGNQLNSTAPH